MPQGFFRKGDSDLADARRTLVSDGPYDTACFHAQQAVEKYLKAYLAWKGQPIPRTHDLEELQTLCVAQAQLTDLAKLDLTELTAYAVELRYDAEFWPSIRLRTKPCIWLKECAPTSSSACLRMRDHRESSFLV